MGGFGWFDTVSYRSALQAYQMVAKERRPQHQAQWQRDEARYKRCDPMRVENKARSTIDFTPEGRQCLIDALAQTASVQGALVLLRNASVALSKDPDDKALRGAALAAIDKARQLLASDRAFYERQERAVAACYGFEYEPSMSDEQMLASLLHENRLRAPVGQLVVS